MNFTESVKAGFENYANFKDRTSRPGFWWWALFVFLVNIIATALDGDPGRTGLFGGIAGLVLLIPNLAVAARRLHDVGKSGWWLLAILIPILGWIYLIYLYVQVGQPEANEWGPPAKGTPGAPSEPMSGASSY